MGMKYRQRGYRESERDDRDRPPRQNRPPSSNLTPEERAQQRSLKHAIGREAQEVVRCPACGRNVQAFGALTRETQCPYCSAPLHSCRACRHFDTGARWECRAAVTERITDKVSANSCTLFEPRLVLDATGKRSATPRGGDDPKSQFDSLFKR